MYIYIYYTHRYTYSKDLTCMFNLFPVFGNEESSTKPQLTPRVAELQSVGPGWPFGPEKCTDCPRDEPPRMRFIDVLFPLVG